MKDTLAQLVKIIYKDRYPLKAEKECKQYCDKATNESTGLIEEWVWTRILDKMYESHDADYLQHQLRHLPPLK